RDLRGRDRATAERVRPGAAHDRPVRGRRVRGSGGTCAAVPGICVSADPERTRAVLCAADGDRTGGGDFESVVAVRQSVGPKPKRGYSPSPLAGAAGQRQTRDMMALLRLFMVLLLVVPAVAAVVVVLLGRQRLAAIRWISLGATLVDLLLA